MAPWQAPAGQSGGANPFNEALIQAQPEQLSPQPSSGAGNQGVTGDGSDGSSLFYGHVSLDLSFSMSESLTRQTTSSGPDGYKTLTENMSRSFQAGLSLDFSFLQQFSGTTDKLSKMDQAVFGEWGQAASDLLDMNPKDFQEFVASTDKLFNEIEKALGLGSTGLDHVAQFFTDQVKGFLGDVKAQMDQFEKNPIGQGNDIGLNIPALFDKAKQAMPGDLQKFLEDQIARQSSEDPKSELLKKLQEIYKRLLDRLNNPEDPKAINDGSANQSGLDIPPPPPPPPGSDGASAVPEEEGAASDKDPGGEEQYLSFSYFQKKTVSISAYLETISQKDPGGNEPGQATSITA
ncbi:MAG: hypothetical protein HZB29_05940 [Nitrospinae bacterium]|nr:hypothetical protein [Nitrospinota bacterium]